MNRLLSIGFAALMTAGCSSSTTTPDTGADGGASGSDSGTGHTDSGSPGQDSGMTAPDGGATGDSGSCTPPQGATCPTTAGNCKDIGKPCTKGGGQCTNGTSCDVDLDPSGNSICITYLTCVPNTGACGTGATCCKTSMTQNVAVCLPNQCIPSDCTAEP
jgi:hypothetical protein